MKKILLLLLIMILFTGCQERTIRYTAKELESNIDATNWNVAFVALDGNLTEGFMVNPTEYPNLNYDISLGSGNMIVQVKQDKEVIELPHKKEPYHWKNSVKDPFIFLFWERKPKTANSALNGLQLGKISFRF